MKRLRLDPVVLAPTRLTILAVLAATEWADFKFVRDTAELSDPTLSKQLTILAEAGLVQVRKGFVGKRARTTMNLTAAGRRALENHVATLQEIADTASRAKSTS
jgi:DNA-binding MarR family transcriptional regulator